MEKEEVEKEVRVGWDVERVMRKYVKEEVVLREEEIRKNIEVLRVGEKEVDLMVEV